ncbi:hypothetical protein BaRGS_00016446 [Batillaria attramentaria]|uniref:C3H1-type domain-containing protein n=1 Tax=Batillaria attramentaria TaxID=370345 RepID=A0ABD0KYT2_9CAEN
MAWNRFLAILAQQSPSLTPHLAHHCEVVLVLAERNCNWRLYDEAFRQLVARHEAQWGSTHLELYLKATLEGQKPSDKPASGMTSTSQSSPNIPPGACKEYHSGGYCGYVPCRYQHKCFNCLAMHPFYQCRAPVSTPFKVLPQFQLHHPSRSGFRVGFSGPLPVATGKNLKSALEYPQVVQAKLQQELSLGRIAGPFQTPPFSQFCTSPLGVVEKKTPGTFRLIHHLSYPEGHSVNDGIPQTEAQVSYQTIDDAVQLVRTLGQGCFMAKTDIAEAFRIIPLSPSQYHLFGFQ